MELRFDLHNMKNILLLLCISFLLTNCYSYRHINLGNDELILNKKYKIKHKYSKQTKVRVYGFRNDSLFFDKAMKEGLPVSEINYLKRRKLSYIKTTGAIISSVILYAIVDYMISPEIAVPEEVFHPLPN